MSLTILYEIISVKQALIVQVYCIIRDEYDSRILLPVCEMMEWFNILWNANGFVSFFYTGFLVILKVYLNKKYCNKLL